MRSIAAALVAAGVAAGWGLASTADAKPDRHAIEMVTLRVRPDYLVCAGSCPWFELHVNASGQVERTNLWSDEHDDDKPPRVVRFRVAQAAVLAFQRVASRAMREGQYLQKGVCKQLLRDDGSPDPMSDPRLDNIELIFKGADGTRRMATCGGNQAVHSVIWDALLALGLDINGMSPHEYAD